MEDITRIAQLEAYNRALQQIVDEGIGPVSRRASRWFNTSMGLLVAAALLVSLVAGMSEGNKQLRAEVVDLYRKAETSCRVQPGRVVYGTYVFDHKLMRVGADCTYVPLDPAKPLPMRSKGS